MSDTFKSQRGAASATSPFLENIATEDGGPATTPFDTGLEDVFSSFLGPAAYPYDPTGFATDQQYRFETHYHPYAQQFVSLVRNGGSAALLRPRDVPATSTGVEPEWLHRQAYTEHDVTGNPSETLFETLYQPVAGRVWGFMPEERIDFGDETAYGAYNWEVFFHVPMLLAKRLSAAGRYADAQAWHHAVFHPLERDASEEAPTSWWRFKPLVFDGTPRRDEDAAAALEQSMADPFNPHAIARLRLRAYQRYVVRAYLDNLIAWGDSLFRRDSFEAINEATQIYLVALDVLGARPRVIPPPPRDAAAAPTYGSLKASSTNELVDTVEGDAFGATLFGVSPDLLAGPSIWKFCVPPNADVLTYWDTLEDRLFKIRNCLDIHGVFRKLSIYEPPIDPGVLVRARAAGLSIEDALTLLQDAQLPPARFQPTLQVAKALAGEVKALGSALLSALEKKDAEHLSALRARHETTLQRRVVDVRRNQVREASARLDGARAQLELVEERAAHYRSLLDDGLLDEEAIQIASLVVAQAVSDAGSGITIASAVVKALGEFQVPAGPSFGPAFIGDGLATLGQGMSAIAAGFNTIASITGIQAGYRRREQDWDLQVRLAAKERTQVQAQIDAATIAVSSAELELEQAETRAEQTAEVADFLRDKYTNEQLYTWMSTEIRRFHTGVYQVAFEIARAAEKAYRHEVGDPAASFISSSHADGDYGTLLAGEALMSELLTMEAAYLQARELELVLRKDVSLASWDPFALQQLIETGSCRISIPEVVFDLDTPGGYFRRIRSMAFSVPCVKGPYANVPCRITLANSRVRMEASAPQSGGEGDGNVRSVRLGRPSSVVLSHGVRDGGTGPDDGRYQPFEGEGVFGDWLLELPTEVPPFDYRTIQDVVFHFEYTERDGGAAIRADNQRTLRERLLSASPWSEAAAGGLVHVLDMTADASAWHAFQHPSGALAGWTKTIARDLYAGARAGLSQQVFGTAVLVRGDWDALDPSNSDMAFELRHDGTTVGTVSLDSLIDPNVAPSYLPFGRDVRAISFSFAPDGLPLEGEWSLLVIDTESTADPKEAPSDWPDLAIADATMLLISTLASS